MPLARSDELTVEELGDELLVYDLRTDRAHSLSPVAARVWRACDGKTQADDLAGRLGLDATEVERALDELERCELLTPGARGGLSRRELTVRFAKGAAAAASAPLIVSIVAPTPAAALTPGCEAIGQCLFDCGQTNHGCKGVACTCCQLDRINCPRGGGGVQRESNVKWCAPGTAANCPSRTDPTLCTTPCPTTAARTSSPQTQAETSTSATGQTAPAGTDPGASQVTPAPEPTPTPTPAPEPAPAPTTPAPETPTTPAPETLQSP